MKALFTWKENEEVTIYKCHNHNCSHRIEKLNALNDDEKKLREERSSLEVLSLRLQRVVQKSLIARVKMVF